MDIKLEIIRDKKALGKYIVRQCYSRVVLIPVLASDEFSTTLQIDNGVYVTKNSVIDLSIRMRRT